MFLVSLFTLPEKNLHKGILIQFNRNYKIILNKKNWYFFHIALEHLSYFFSFHFNKTSGSDEMI